MLQGHNIICFSSDWHQDPLSKHHIMSRLAKQNKILWINSIGMRSPTLSGKDLSKAMAKVKSFFHNRLEKVNDNLYVLSPLVLPFHGSRVFNYINKHLLLRQIKNIKNELGFNDPILWTFLPNAVGVFGQFNEKLTLYYITDDFTKFTGHPGRAIQDMEEKLIKKADVVIASAQRLIKNKTQPGKTIELVSHGVDWEHFAQAQKIGKQNLPDDIKDIVHPIIGFYGEINDWLDLETLSQVAKQRPQWSFVLLGRIAGEVGNIDYLLNLPNVHWLGQKKYSELPGYCAAFDAALIPMKLNELTLNVNPLKLREYLAAGVPVVSAPLPEVLPYQDTVKLAVTPEEYIAAIEECLKRPKNEQSQALSKRVKTESWDSKVEEISRIIEKAMLPCCHSSL